jgi:hypothetical protein
VVAILAKHGFFPKRIHALAAPGLSCFPLFLLPLYQGVIAGNPGPGIYRAFTP